MSAEISIFHLYRQRLPAAAPQALQILSTCHGLATAGAEVTLRVDPPIDGTVREAGEVLHHYGLTPHPRLHLEWLARYRPLAGLQFRAALPGWLRAARAAGRRPIVLSRRLDYAAWLLRWRRRLGIPVGLVYEWHYVSSANAREAGQEAEARDLSEDEAVVLAGADAHVAVSEALRRYLEAHHAPARPVVMIPNGGPTPLSIEAVGRLAGRGEGAPCRGGTEAGARATVVYAGLFRRPRDLEGLIGAVREMPSDIDLIVIGGDEEGRRLETVQARVREAGLEGRIRFTGPLSPVAVREALAGATVAVATFASSINMHHFASPLKVLEYHAAGIPLVASDFPTVRELVRHGKTGLLVPPEDPSALATAVRQIIDHPALARHLAREGLREAAERTWIRRGERLLELMRELPALPDSRFRTPDSLKG